MTTGPGRGGRGTNQYATKGASTGQNRRVVSSLAGRVEVPDVELGVRFRSTIADSNPEWEVTRRISSGPDDDPVWEAQIVGDVDYQGHVDVFRESVIRSSLAQTEGIRRLVARDDQFWQDQVPGSTVHYHNGFGQFVRCEVVVRPDGTHAAKPVALVGNWQPYDLPRWSDDGEWVLPHHAKRITEGDSWQPTTGTVYESVSYTGSATVDPRQMDPIPLDPTPRTSDQVTAAEDRAFRKEIGRLFTSIRADEDDLVFLAEVRDRIGVYLDQRT